MKYSNCPRCHKQTLIVGEPTLNALSRRDSKTYICTLCGTEESFIDAGFQMIDKTERVFVAQLENRKELNQ